MTYSMHHNRLLALVVTLLIGGSWSVQAQPTAVDGVILTETRLGAGTGGVDQLEVTVQLQAIGGTFDLGTSSLMLTFDASAISLPSSPGVNQALTSGSDYAFADPYIGSVGEGKFYGSSSITLFGATNRLAVNLVLDIEDFGQPVATTYTSVATLFFDIEDGGLEPGLAWVPDTDSNPTVIYQSDNQTVIPNGVFTVETALPVELSRFGVQYEGDTAYLRWETLRESGNLGFEVEHEAPETLSFQRMGFAEGHGTTFEAHAYHYMVPDLAPGQHRFRLRQIDYDGTWSYSKTVAIDVDLPQAFLLESPYPNPFTLTAAVDFAVREAQPVRVALHDALGRPVAQLFDGVPAPGEVHRVPIDGTNLPSGLYLIRLTSGSHTQTRSVLLAK